MRQSWAKCGVTMLNPNPASDSLTLLRILPTLKSGRKTGRRTIEEIPDSPVLLISFGLSNKPVPDAAVAINVRKVQLPREVELAITLYLSSQIARYILHYYPTIPRVTYLIDQLQRRPTTHPGITGYTLLITGPVRSLGVYRPFSGYHADAQCNGIRRLPSLMV